MAPASRRRQQAASGVTQADAPAGLPGRQRTNLSLNLGGADDDSAHRARALVGVDEPRHTREPAEARELRARTRTQAQQEMRTSGSAADFAYRRHQPSRASATTTSRQSNGTATSDCCQETFCCRCCCRRRSDSERVASKSQLATSDSGGRDDECCQQAARGAQGRPPSESTRHFVKGAPRTRLASRQSNERDHQERTRGGERNQVHPNEQEQDQLREEMGGHPRQIKGARAEMTPSEESESRHARRDKNEDVAPANRKHADGHTNRWSRRHSAGCTSPSLSASSGLSPSASSVSPSSSLNSLSSLNSIELGRGGPQQANGAPTTMHFSQLTGGTSVAVLPGAGGIRSGAKRRPAPLPPPAGWPARRSQSVSDIMPATVVAAAGGRPEASVTETTETHLDQRPSELLSEQEAQAIEHFLRSHKSSVYVCGCMANLYFTRTHLADNGRASKAASGEWRLNKTGVPVLIFDSGLAKNRQKRRLSISLTERGSGFVLWSDTIDHLSNYRAFSPSLHSLEGGSGPQGHPGGQDACDSFHVMYLSSNHRIMVGLSFDNPLCARLFLAQIELVCADPANISLSGPKWQAKSGGGIGSGGVGGAPAGGKLTLTLSNGALPTNGGRVGGLVSRLRLFSFASGAPAPATATSRAYQINEAPSFASSSWSTLKRAARRGLGAAGGGGGGSQQTTDGRRQSSVVGPRELGAELYEAFKPRPLAQLAAEGKIWSHKARSSRATSTGASAAETSEGGNSKKRRPAAHQLKRIPRKCDISAPCLFQHVTSVDQTNLEQLYSKSFVLERRLERETRTNDATSGAGRQQAPGEGLKPQPEARIPAADEIVAGRGEPPSRPGPADESEAPAAKGLSLSSSSSCYSSGSRNSSCVYSATSCAARSPTGSDSDRLSGAECTGSEGSTGQPRWQPRAVGPSRQLVGRRGTGSACTMAVRPPVAPPKPPQRDFRSGSSFDGAARASATPAAGRTKVNAILRELQAQVSGDLVDAKRRLMADIANRAKALPEATSAETPSGARGRPGVLSSEPSARRQVPASSAASGGRPSAKPSTQTSISRL